jgi:signal transduction histidine kinase
MQAIRTFVDLAPAKMEEERMNLAGLRNPDFWKEYYQNVQNQIVRINGMLNDLWSASEKPSTEYADTVQLHTVVRDAVAQVNGALGAKNITVDNQVPETLPELHVDKVKFHRLFELLLKDEAASLPPGTRIQITAELAADSPAGRPEVQIRLSDNGPGMPKEALRLVFDPFVVRSDTPMEYGIHLMACYFIVHHHGGKIDARSQDGEGTTFIIRIPVDPRQTPMTQNEHEFLQKVVLNESLWQKLIAAE